MSFTKVEMPGLKGYKKVSIRPYFDPSIENMGLEKYNLALYDGVYHTEQLCCLENNGIKRYVSGLNEFAPEVKGIKDPEARAAKIKEIRAVVTQLEAEFAANIIDPEDPEFWNKVQLLRPDNDEFWDRIELKAGNDITVTGAGEAGNNDTFTIASVTATTITLDGAEKGDGVTITNTSTSGDLICLVACDPNGWCAPTNPDSWTSP